MKIDQNRIRHLAQRCFGHHPINSGERIIKRVHIKPRHGVDDENTGAGLGFNHCGAPSGRCRRIIDRTQQFWLAFDKNQRLALIKRVVTERDRVGTRIEKIVADRFGDAKATRSVLAIDHHTIEIPAATQSGKRIKNGISS